MLSVFLSGRWLLDLQVQTIDHGQSTIEKTFANSLFDDCRWSMVGR
jgi:hypothetical protein